MALDIREGTSPLIFPFITLRYERFGALLFNPYTGIYMELDPVEAYIASLSNGHNTCPRIEKIICQYFGFTQLKSKRYVSATIKKIMDAGALDFFKVIEVAISNLPDIPSFPPDGPYLSAPISAIWDVTYTCNLRCLHCLTSSGRAHRDELNTRQALDLIDRLADAKIFTLLLSGGEPFMRPDIITLLRHISTTGIRVDIATNGVKLPSPVLRALRDLPVFHIHVSLDGIGKRHDRLRGRSGTFDAACRTIRKLQSEGIAVSINTTVNTENLDDLESLIDLAVEMGCQGFLTNVFLPIGRGYENARRLELGLEELLRFNHILIKKSVELNGKLHIPLDACFSFLFEPHSNIKTTDGHVGCAAGQTVISVGADGTVYPCPFLHKFPLGNLMETPLKEIWSTSPILHTLKTLRKEDIGEPCRSCKYASRPCGCGCRAAAFAKYGDLKAADPNCIKPLIYGRDRKKIKS